jgi:hypothetical protein
LYDWKVPPSAIGGILNDFLGNDSRMFLPKTLFNINEKCRNLFNSLISIADGILKSDSDAEKIIKLLEK